MRSRVVIAAIITASATIIAAIIGFMAREANSATGAASSRGTPAASYGATPRNLTPRATKSPQVPHTPSPSPSPTPSSLSNGVQVLVPKDDPGYSPIWHGVFSINDAGVRISSTGVYTADPQNWDLAYQAGGDISGWQENTNVSNAPVVYEYQGTGTPDPAWCNRELYSGNDVSGQLAQVGDRECYGDNNGVIGYFQVTGVGPNGPTIKAWFWKVPST
jgi:hypothetical protein